MNVEIVREFLLTVNVLGRKDACVSVEWDKEGRESTPLLFGAPRGRFWKIYIEPSKQSIRMPFFPPDSQPCTVKVNKILIQNKTVRIAS